MERGGKQGRLDRHSPLPLLFYPRALASFTLKRLSLGGLKSMLGLIYTLLRH
jgi:hypothetical protein